MSRHLTFIKTFLGSFATTYLLAVASLSTQANASETRTILFNAGTILTLDDDKAEAQALVIDGKHISFVGSNREALRFRQKHTKILDLQGRVVLPGFIESHGHLLGIGRSRTLLNLSDTTHEEEVLSLVVGKAQKTRQGAWILGRGWDQNQWPSRQFPNHQRLSEATPDHPVKLTRVDGHAAWYNKRAFSIAGITRATADPAGGRIIRDAEGEPSGVLVDTAMDLVDRYLPTASPAENRQALQLGFAALLEAGITSFHDAGANAETIALYKSLLAEGQLPLRLYVMISGNQRALREHYLQAGPQLDLGDGFLNIRSIKLMADGALGSRGAALLEPYSDDPSQRGSLMLSLSELTTITQQALRSGFQVATHAIGDRANRMVLDAYAAALQAAPQHPSPRLRIEHAQLLHPADVARFGPLGIVASMQALHCPSDMPWTIQRLGLQRANQRAYPWQALRQSGAILAFGSDAPVEAFNPIQGLYAAVYRQDPEGRPAGGGWQAHQRLTIDEALAAYTKGAAYAEFSEHRKGKLKAGYLADMIALDRDPRRVPQKDFLRTRVNLTIINGKVAFERL